MHPIINERPACARRPGAQWTQQPPHHTAGYVAMTLCDTGPESALIAPATATTSTNQLPNKFGSSTFVIRSYEAADHKRVCDLFADGMLYYAPSIDKDPWLHHGFNKYLQECFDGDLKDISGTYMGSGGHFWVVTTATTKQGKEANGHNESIVAIVALEHKGNGKGELRRLSVTEEYRGHGLGAKLVGHVEEWGKAHGFTSITMNTDCVMTGALRLYDKLGYTRTHHETIREDPYYYLVWFEKVLA